MIEIHQETLKKKGLTPDQYAVLWCIVNKEKPVWLDLNTREDRSTYMKIIKFLQDKLWIKISSSNTIQLRQKTLNLNLTYVEDVGFEAFWDKYKEVTGMKKTDMASAKKYWKALTKSEKKKAFDNIEPYYNSLPMFPSGKPVKKARTYLSEKNFNDEFEDEVKTVVNPHNRML